MKKTIAALAIAVVGFSAQASYLFWQVNAGSDLSRLSEDVVGSITYAQLVIEKDGSVLYTSGPAKIDTSASPISMAGPVSIDVSTIDMSKYAYSFYIELGTYASSTFSGKAISQTINTTIGSDWATYTALNNAIYETSTLPASGVATVTPWHGGTYSVPEPTSAILMLFGAAFLGLKRKNRSIV